MASTTKFKIVNAFADDSTRDLEFGPFDSDTVNIETLRTAIKNFDAGAISDTYIADSGSGFASIQAATVVEVTENEINLNVE